LSSEKAILNRAAEILRREVLVAFETTDAMPWPPSAQMAMDRNAPQCVNDLVSKVTTGKDLMKITERPARCCMAIAEDLCYAATNGRWMMAKHTLLGMSLRHLTGRADVITIFNRYGHCMSYCKVLELEKALAMQVQLTEDDIPTNISRTGNVVSHLCWDNFDLMEETPSGKGTTHSTHGIVIQEACQDIQFGSPVDDVVSVSRTGARSVKVCQPLSVAGVMVPKKVEPVFTASSTTEACIPSLLCSTASCLYWLTCRALFNISSCIPDWSGWVSQTTSYCQHVQPSNIGYMAPIQSPITDVSVG